MHQKIVANSVAAIVIALVAISYVAGAFTPTEQTTIKALRARIAALEAADVTQNAALTSAQTSIVTMQADIDTLFANQNGMAADIDTLDANTKSVDQGLNGLVADNGPLWQIDHNLADLQNFVWDRVPVIALTNIKPTVTCGATTCSVTVAWDSAPPATGQVEWGQTTAYGNLTTLETNLLDHHIQTIGTLPKDGKTYHFRVLATTPDEDVAGVDTTLVAQ